MRNYTLTILYVAFIVTISRTGYSDQVPTPEELVMLMKASSERYRTFDVNLSTISYMKTDPNNAPSLAFTRKITSRWTKNKKRTYSMVEQKFSDDYSNAFFRSTKPVLKITKHASTPKWSKRLVESSDMRKIHAYVTPSIGMEIDGYVSVYDAMWDLFGWPFEQINYDEARVTRDEKRNLYILKARLGSSPEGPKIVLSIDPSKDYIPVEKEFLKSDGTLLVRFESSDFRQIKDDLWIPYSYSWLDPGGNFSEFYKVEEIKLNEPIPNKLLDFSFPSGTIVHDEIAGLRYRVDEILEDALDVIGEPFEDVTTAVIDSNILKREDITTGEPAEEKELTDKALKAKELIHPFPNTKKQDNNANCYPKILSAMVLIVGLIVIYYFIIHPMKHKI